MNVLDLFSGIGGFSLGLERAGMRTVAFCEIDPFCRRVLAKHWPDVPCYTDVRTLTAHHLAADGISVDAICGGFPCQDVSNAGARAGIDGARSGLWSEIVRLIRELQPRYAIVENVSALLDRGMGRVLGDLAEVGYDAQWDCISAADIGLPQARDRVWIVAYATGQHVEESALVSSEILHGQSRRTRPDESRSFPYWEADQPALVGMADGVPQHLDGRDYANRTAALGNSVVPQIPEIIGRAIMRASAVASHNSRESQP